MPRPPRKKIPLEPAGTRANESKAPLPSKPRHGTKNTSIKAVRATPQPKAKAGRLPPTLPPSAMKVQNTPSFMSFTQRPRQGSILRQIQTEAERDAEDDTTYFSLDQSLPPSSGSKRKSMEGHAEGEVNAQKRRRSSRGRKEEPLVIVQRSLSASSTPEVEQASEVDQAQDEAWDEVHAELRANESGGEPEHETEVQVPATAPEHDTSRQSTPDIDDLLGRDDERSVRERGPSSSPHSAHHQHSPEPTLDLAQATPSSPGSTYLAAAFTNTRTRTRKPLASKSQAPQAARRAKSNLPLARSPTPTPPSPADPPTSPLSSPLSSPTSKATTRRGATNPPPRAPRRQPERFMRTADLTALLPRRRNKPSRYAAFDILDSDDPAPRDDSSADEYGRARRKAKPRGATAVKTKTYAPPADEEEPEPLPQEDARRTSEMQAAARQFADVDAWELSFESADVAGASSPWR